MNKHYFLICAAVIIFTCEAGGGILHVPGTYTSIQSAINASTPGDTVLVQPGIYFENINFRGKRIVVTSTFYFTNDVSIIDSTIINGSAPSSPDTGSCVLIISGEDTTALLQGFTLTGGTGTLWPDEHGPGSYVEGGGILIALSSPTIRHNIIRNNNVNRTGGTSTGGGGIRLGDGSPHIFNNFITQNSGQYGGGIVSNYATPIIKNNIISKNVVSNAVGGPTYGGGGVWVNHDPALMENNTIAENSSSGTGSAVAGNGGGISAVFGGQITGRNNIVWGNIQTTGGQIFGTATLSYSDVQGGYTGTGNISDQPNFSDSSYYLPTLSPCVDAGDPGSSYNDPEDLLSPGHAKRPSKGGLRNDMGAYGGPGSEKLHASFEAPVFSKITAGQIVNDGGASRSVNWIDYDNDGILDLFVSNGLSSGQNNFLYHGDGPPNYTFTKITGSPIVSDHEKSDGSSWADVDNNGTLDAFVVNWYNDNNMFYWNNGNGTFIQSSTGPIVNDGGYSETASWGDYDNDGYVDLYVANSAGSLQNFLYHNNGDSTFTKIATGAIVNDTYHSRGITWIDYDNDGDEDMFVANENGESNTLYKNMLKETGLPNFVKITSGNIVNDSADSWSASWGDYDNDGYQDLFVANFSGQNNFLYHNNGDGTFTKITSGIIVNDGGWSASCAWGDVDNDGDLDLIVTNAYGSGAHTNYLYRNLLMETGSPTFEKITSGPLVNDLGWSYGVSFGDYNNDGNLDVFVAKTFNENENNALYRNENDNGNHWVELRCSGTSSNRSAIGTKVHVSATINGHPVHQMREISGQSGYCGQNLIVHFGLGNAAIIDSLTFEWPKGSTELFTNIVPNQTISVTEQDTNPPLLVNPPAGSINQHSTVLFKWKPTSGNPLFHLEVAKDSTFGSIIFNDSTLADTSKQVSSLTYATTYYWRIAVKKLNRISHWSEARNFTLGPEMLTYSVDRRWNIISIPVVPVHPLKDSLFPDAISSAYKYDNGSSYQQQDTLETGTGYWIKFPSAQPVSFNGYRLDTDTIDVKKGWNLIGTIFFPLTVDELTTIPQSIINSSIYGFDGGGYVVTDSLLPLHGYWVRTNQEGRIILSSAASSVPKTRQPALIQNTNTLQFEDSEGNTQVLKFASTDTEEDNNGHYDLPPQTPKGIFDVRFTSGRFMEFTHTSASEQFPISLNGGSGQITISWKIADTAYLSSIIAVGKEFPLNRNGKMSLPEKNNRLILVVKQKDIPLHFSIAQNYPNPFNPITVIKYQLPVGSKVTLKIYNLLGQEIRTLADDIQNAGYRSVEWNSTNTAGNTVASGVYFYRLQATSTANPNRSFVQVKKMLLLK